ncbi:hypothetical protein LCGC14_2952350 [marine sediment metagenome]|uniref:Resolvase HTH domain-containing protein n=1 Tax=marine sediment metagenome TaxID=412755 RepID=A0A0F8Y223_9ZZZZ
MKNSKILTNLTKSVRSEDIMKTPEFVEQILELAAQGWGKKRIAKELGTTVKTVKRYLQQKEWIPEQKARMRVESNISKETV